MQHSKDKWNQWADERIDVCLSRLLEQVILADMERSVDAMHSESLLMGITIRVCANVSGAIDQLF